MTWIVTANTNECRIYEYNDKNTTLTLLDSISHPENKLRSHELGNDRPGHYQTRSTSRGAYSPHHEPHEIKIDDFARELAIKLDAARNKHQYHRLIFIMPAQMEGQVLPHLHKPVADLIKQIIPKNIMHLSDHELRIFLAEHLE
jgi:protein required for attachment to host cells